MLANTIRHSNNKIPKSVDICTFINDTTKGKKFLEDIVANNTIEELKSDPEFMETVAGILDTENNAKIINNLKEIALISTVKLTDGMKSKPQSIKNADGALAWFQFVANQIIAIYNVFF